MNYDELIQAVGDAFAPGGPIAQQVGPEYALRAGQVQLAQQLAFARPRWKHLLAEGVTGVGKSLAYIVPSALALKDPEIPVDRVVIATANIALQEQLTNKDLPLVREALWPEMSFGLLKGKSNYLCLLKFEEAQERAPNHQDVLLVERWLQDTELGDKSELDQTIDTWHMMSTSADNCIGKQCSHYENCFAKLAQQRAFKSDIIVTNFHLLILLGPNFPRHQVLICDEGHELAPIARNVLGFTINQRNLQWAKGRLESLGLNNDAMQMASAIDSFEDYYEDFLGDRRQERRIISKDELPPFDRMTECLIILESALAEACVEAQDALDTVTLGKRQQDLKRVQNLRTKIGQLEQLAPEFVFWAERKEERFKTKNRQKKWKTRGTDESSTSILVQGRPVEVQEELEKAIYIQHPTKKEEERGELPDPKTVMIVSATMQTSDGFGFVANELGLNDETTESLAVDSPFNMREQGTLIIPRSMPSIPGYPRDPTEEAAFHHMMIEHIAHFVNLCDGRVLGLFTSWTALKKVYDGLRAKRGFNLPVFKQGDKPRSVLVRDFRNRQDGLLMGVESFWTGIDIPGMKGVFIDKLPFPVPSNPLFAAQSELCEKRGGMPFYDLSLPIATLKLRQGAGRLIRRASDSGRVMILDRRLLDKGYGDQVIQALPDFYFMGRLEGFDAVQAQAPAPPPVKITMSGPVTRRRSL
jgi:ATP-dependent DNA helicase DinG